MTLGSHQAPIGASQDWITPKWIIDALGPFDLDPCASLTQPWMCAWNSYAERGLEQEWRGRVWLNPPFDRRVVGLWIEKLASHGDGVALVHARTEAAWFVPIWRKATGILFLDKRVTFHRPDGTKGIGNSGAPVCLAAFGKSCARLVRDSGIRGALLETWSYR